MARSAKRSASQIVGASLPPVLAQAIELVDPDSLTLHPQNARKGNIDRIAKLIEANGFYKPLTVQRSTGYVLTGNHTLQAARRLGLQTVPVVFVDVDDTKASEILLGDNKSSDDSTYDLEVLYNLLSSVDAQSGLMATGYEAADLAFLKSILEDRNRPVKEITDEACQDLRKKWGVEVGDVWRCGESLITCGDSTDLDVVAKVMNGERAAMCFTDPPWNVALGDNATAHRAKRKSIANDKLTDHEWERFLANVASVIKHVLDGDLYLVMASQTMYQIDAALRSVGFHWSTQIVWVKNSMVIGRKAYHAQYEPIWYGWPKDKKSSYCGDRKQTDVWPIDRPSASKLHPTTKPIELVEKAVLNSSKPGDIVFEPFSGSGSTMLACYRQHRSCRAIEIEPGYVAVALERLHEAGATVELISRSEASGKP
jgi:DNA modification methylase